ncbi:globin-like isoform X1 [Artemia franciscana]|uniref:globin-like isoform X1 n=1 Tax=Artemia franciscana TaxID=6661 RepID=UPI0032D9FA44
MFGLPYCQFSPVRILKLTNGKRVYFNAWIFQCHNKLSKKSQVITANNMEEPCHVTGLTLTEKSAIKKSWEIVMENKAQHGVALFKAFFMAHPEYQQYFKAFNKVSLEDLEKSPFLKAHATSVMSAINEVVCNLDEVEILGILLEKIGFSHARREIRRIHFENLAKVVVAYLIQALGSHLTEEGADAWRKALCVMIDIIEKGSTSERW